jgi:hypothetical protein
MFISVLALAVDIPNRVTKNDHLVESRDVLSFLASHIFETKALSAGDRRVVGVVVRWESMWEFCTNPLGLWQKSLIWPHVFLPTWAPPACWDLPVRVLRHGGLWIYSIRQFV